MKHCCIRQLHFMPENGFRKRLFEDGKSNGKILAVKKAAAAGRKYTEITMQIVICCCFLPAAAAFYDFIPS